MKKISAAALVATARSKGASLELDDLTVNAERERLPAVLPLRRPTPPPQAAAMKVDIDTRELVQAAQAGERRADALAAVVQALIKEMRAQRDSSPAPIQGWDFKTHRDEDKNLCIRATAIR